LAALILSGIILSIAKSTERVCKLHPVFPCLSDQESSMQSFDLTLPCPICGYRIPPSEILRLANHIVQCPSCKQPFDQMQGKKPASTS
jgi:DNA-directed RNA polymerase subunit RPC12/RpoP